LNKGLLYTLLIISHLVILVAGALFYERERGTRIIPLSDKKISINYPFRFNRVGDAKSPVTVMLFGRYEHENSKKAKEFSSKLMSLYEGKVQLIYVPLKIVDKPEYNDICYGAYAAGKLGKFWDYANHFIETKDFTNAGLDGIVEKLKLPKKEFDKLRESKEAKEFYKLNYKLAEDYKISKVPAFTINGSYVDRLVSANQLKTLIDFELKK